MEDHPGDVALLDAIEEAANEIERLDRERDAIRAKTFQRCEELAGDRAETFHIECRRMAARDIRDSIRALAQTDEGKTESGDMHCISELEAEREQMIRIAKTWRDRCEYAEGREPAIRAKTIEECAKWLEDMPEHWRTLARDMRRALAQTHEAKDE